MALRRLLKLACPAACAVCLAAGYAAAGKWLMLAPVALVWLGWMFTASWPPSVLLAACAGLAAGGLWAGASPFLMLPAAALALASWDVVQWNDFLAGDLSAVVEARLERRHYACLALALGPGLLAALAGRLIHFQIAFGILVVVVLLMLATLDRVWRLVK